MQAAYSVLLNLATTIPRSRISFLSTAARRTRPNSLMQPNSSMCCSLTLYNDTTNGNNAGPQGWDFEGSATFADWGITFVGGSFGQQKAGQPNITCHDTNSSRQVKVDFVGTLYMEPTHSSDTTTALHRRRWLLCTQLRCNSGRVLGCQHSETCYNHHQRLSDSGSHQSNESSELCRNVGFPCDRRIESIHWPFGCD